MGIGPFRVGPAELLIILFIVLLIFGPKNLPKLGSALGKTVKNLREGMGSAQKEIGEADDEAVDEEASVVATESVEEEKPAADAAPAKKTVRRVVKKKAE